MNDKIIINNIKLLEAVSNKLMGKADEICELNTDVKITFNYFKLCICCGDILFISITDDHRLLFLIDKYVNNYDFSELVKCVQYVMACRIHKANRIRYGIVIKE